MTLPIGRSARECIGRNMTLGIRPEHIALSLQAEGGVPLVVDTLEMLGADNLAHGRWGEQKLVVRLAHQNNAHGRQYAVAASARTSSASF